MGVFSALSTAFSAARSVVGAGARGIGKFARDAVKGVRTTNGLGWSKPGRGAVGALGAAWKDVKRNVISPIYELDWAVSGIARMAGAVSPYYIEQVTVRVTGNPLSSMYRLHQLALAAAFGTVAPFGTRAGARGITISYHYNEKVVECRYYWSYNLVAISGSSVGPQASSGVDRIIFGPNANNGDGFALRSGGAIGVESVPSKQKGGMFNITGGQWPLILKSGSGDTNSLYPLPDADKTILTYQAAASTSIPQPPWDGASRGNDLVRLATQIILAPCCPPQPADTSKVYNVAQNPSWDFVSQPTAPSNIPQFQFPAATDGSTTIDPVSGLLFYNSVVTSTWNFNSGNFVVEFEDNASIKAAPNGASFTTE